MRLLLIVAVGAGLTATVGAQQAPKIPIRAVATTATVQNAGAISGVRQFANGRVLANDVSGRRLLMFDSTLANMQITADSDGVSGAKYPGGPYTSANLFYYLGDSAVVTDASTQSFIIVGPDGKLGRTMAHPRPRDMTTLSAPYRGNPGFDERGRFYYVGGANASPRPKPGEPPKYADTLNIVRADFDTRTVDSIGKMTRPINQSPGVTWDDKGVASAKSIINPVPVAPDGWAVLTDGSLGVVRAHDYHVDWLYPDGTIASTPKMPFDWRRLTDEDKQAKIDSIKRFIAAYNDTARSKYGTMYAGRAVVPGKTDTVVPTIEFVPLSQILDYVPALRNGSVTADRDNHLWILPTTTLSATGGGLLYDVVDRKGEIMERVQLPAGRRIIGFGAGGIVYLSAGDWRTGYSFERARIVR